MKYPTRHILLIFLAIQTVIAVSARAEETNILTADKVLTAALAHSYAIRIADQESTASEASERQAKAAMEPSWTAEASAVRYFGLEDAQLTPQFVIPGIEERYAASLNFRDIISSGGEIENRIEAASFRRQSAGQTLEATTSDTIFRAKTAYWNWSRAFHAVAALDSAVQRVSAHSTDIRNARDAGLATENDALATEVLLEQTRLRLQETIRKVELARLALGHLTGLSIPADTVPEQAQESVTEDIPVMESAVASALKNRPELRAAELDSRAARAMIKSAEAGNKPRFLLSARIGAANPNQLFFPPEEEWNQDIFAGAAIQLPMWDSGATSARRKEASARSEQARLRLEALNEQCALEAEESLVNLRQSIAAVAVAGRVETSAEKNLESADALWKAGMARHADLLDAHAKLTEARFAGVSARTDVILARAALERAMALDTNADGNKNNQ